MSRDEEEGAGERGPHARPGVVAKFALLLGTLAFCAGFAEFAFRLVGYSSLYDVYSKPSLFWRHDADLGWSHEPGATGNYVGPRPFPIEFEAPVRINSLGLRGPEVGPKAPGELRLLFLGDSVTVGFEVANEDTFVARMEKPLSRRLQRPVRTVNAAVRGYGTDQSLLYYRERGRALEPDVVLLVHSDNDTNDNVTLHRARRPFGKPAFALAADGSLSPVGHPVPAYPLCSAWMLSAEGEAVDVGSAGQRAACLLQTRFADHSAAFGFASRTLSRFPGILWTLKRWTAPAVQDESRRESSAGPPLRQAGLFASDARAAPALASGFELTTALVVELAREVAGDGAKFLLIVTKGADLAQLDLPRLEAANVDVRVMRSEAAPELMRWRNDSHLNEAGHRHLADLLVRGLLPELRGLGR